MNKKIMDIFKTIGIKAYYQQCTNKTDNYAIFSFFSEQDVEVAEDESNAIKYNVTINYWFDKTCKHLDNYKLIKQEMKKNGFVFDGSVDLTSETYFGKNMDFIIKVWN